MKKSTRKSRERRKNIRRRRAFNKKLKKDFINITDLFKNIDIDPLEDIIKRINIDILNTPTTQHISNLVYQSAYSTSNP